MNNLSKFKSKVSADKKLQKRMNEASTIKDVVKIAKSIGCHVTENEIKDDMMKAISGGAGPIQTPIQTPIPNLAGTVAGTTGVSVTTGDNTIKFYENIRKEALVTQNAVGTNSVASNSGNISIG